MDQVVSFNFTSSNQAFGGLWSYDYEGISRANLAISYLTDPAVISKIAIDASLKNRLLGEAYFLRAFYYFDLVNNFGDVPLLLTPLKNFDEAYAVAKREAKATVYTQISADLAQARTLLPASKYSDAADKWRVSRGAAIAMQAKVALYNQKWAEVVTAVSDMPRAAQSMYVVERRRLPSANRRCTSASSDSSSTEMHRCRCREDAATRAWSCGSFAPRNHAHDPLECRREPRWAP